jgi:hypothetical protein
MSGDVAVEVNPERENEWGFAGADKWAEKLQKLSFLSFGKLPSLGRQMDKNRGQSVRFRKDADNFDNVRFKTRIKSAE